MDCWIDIKTKQPERGEVVETKDSEGIEHLAYLCRHCGKEWRCGISGYGLMIDVVAWRPYLTTAST